MATEGVQLPIRSGLSRSRSGRGALIVVALVCLSLLAVHPFTTGQMPQTADGILHLYRLVSFDHTIRHDSLFARYAPGLAYGYGVPFFNYYSPSSLYAPETFYRLGMSFLDAWLAAMVFYTFLGAVGAYLFGRVWLGQIAGMVTAVAYTYAPYTLFDSVWRGTVSEFGALALLPWVMWALWRLAVYGRRRDLVLAVGLYALFIPIHNVITLHSTALLVVYAAFLWWHGADRRRVFVVLALVFVLALALTAFFWLPALAETGFVKIEGVTANLPDIDVVRNLLTPGEVFALPITADPTQLQQPMPVALGWPQIVLGGMGLIVVLFQPIARDGRGDSRIAPSANLLHRWLLLLVALLAVVIFMNLEASAFVWRIVPLIRYSQFPWRLLGLASLILALLAGAGVALIARRIASPIGKAFWVGSALIAMMIYAMPWLYSLYLPEPSAASIRDVQAFERATDWIATSSFGEYLPAWNREPLDPDRLIDRYAQTEVIPRLEPPPGVTVHEADWGPTDGTLRVTAEDETTLVFDWLFFPEWRATLDGGALTVIPSDPHGLVSVTVPAGEHRLEIGLTATATQSTATAISIGGLIGLGVVLGLWQSASNHEIIRRGARPHAPPYPPLVIRMAAIIGVALFAAKALWLDQAATPIKRERFAAGVENGLQTPIMANFGNQITLLGYDLAGNNLSLYWRLNSEQADDDYSSAIHLRDAAGNVVMQTGSFQPGGLATSNWLFGTYVQERLSLEVPPGTPPGDYSIDVGLFSATSGRALNHINALGNPEDVQVPLGTLSVTRPDRPASLIEMGIDTTLDARLTADITLLAVESLPEEAEVGQPFASEWVWRAESRPARDTRMRLLWRDADGVIAAESAVVPLVIAYPSELWQTGDVWRGLHTFHVPGRLNAGDYDVVLDLYDAGVEPVVIGRMQVSTPPRRFELPEIESPVDVVWQNGIHLLGYDLSTLSGETIDLRLIWQPEDELNISLRFFAHLLDTDERIVAQVDGVPVEWTRPTTGWAPGEVITEALTLTVPDESTPGEYTLRLGWYDPLTGDRVRLDDGDFWTLPVTIPLIGS